MMWAGLRHLARWLWTSGSSRERPVLGDLDGNGQDVIIINFGDGGGGVWVLGNLSTWIHALSSSPKQMVVGPFH